MITYEPLNEYYIHGNLVQLVKVLFNKIESENILHRSYFPYNWTQDPIYSYEIGGFDCLDKNYDKKFAIFKEFANQYGAEVVEDEWIFFSLPDDTDEKVLFEINEKRKKMFDKL